VDRGSTIEEHDTPGDNKCCAGIHYLSVWNPSNSNNRPGAFFPVTPI
jgi:glutamate synthase domain-containing protein 2